MSKTKEDTEQTQLFAFNRVKNLTFLPIKERAVLNFYAENYNWAKNEGSHWSQEKICELLGIKSVKTLRGFNQNLEKLNWISIEKKFATPTSNYQSSFVQIHIGIDDPNTIKTHQQNLIAQISKDPDSSESQKNRAINFIESHGRFETELQALQLAKENFKKHHPNIYSREIFLKNQETNSEKAWKLPTNNEEQ